MLANGKLTLNGAPSSPDVVAYTALRELRDKWRKSATPGQAFHGQALITLAGAATVDQLLSTLWSAFRSGHPNLIVDLGGERVWLGWQLPPPAPPAKGEPVGPETLVPVEPHVDNSFVVVLDDAECVIHSKLDPAAPVTTRASGVAPSFDPAAHAALAKQVRDAWPKGPSRPRQVHVIVQIKRVADARAVVAALLALARELPENTAIDLSPVGHERAL